MLVIYLLSKLYIVDDYNHNLSPESQHNFLARLTSALTSFFFYSSPASLIKRCAVSTVLKSSIIILYFTLLQLRITYQTVCGVNGPLIIHHNPLFYPSLASHHMSKFERRWYFRTPIGGKYKLISC